MADGREQKVPQPNAGLQAAANHKMMAGLTLYIAGISIVVSVGVFYFFKWSESRESASA